MGSPTRWNGRVFEEPDPRYLGTAHADGSMTISRPNVSDRVRDAYLAAREGRQLGAKDLYLLRDAVLTTIHEAAHLSSHPGRPDDPAATGLGDNAEVALEEGLTETWAHDNADRIIQDIGLGAVAPGLHQQPSINAYPAYTGATDALVDELSRRTGLPADRLRSSVHDSDRAHRWGALAELVSTHRLGRLMPSEHRPAAREAIANAARTEFAKLRAIEESRQQPPEVRADQGAAVGAKAARDIDAMLTQAERHYTSSLQQGSQPGRAPAPERSAPPRTTVDPPYRGGDQELAHLQKFLGGQTAPAAATTTGARTGRTPLVPRGTGRDLD